jgi:hypothetical protein
MRLAGKAALGHGRRAHFQDKAAMQLYRLITGFDDSEFCHRVTAALNRGWRLSGPPTMAFDSVQGRTVCGQAVVKEVEGVEYSPDMKLRDW